MSPLNLEMPISENTSNEKKDRLNYESTGYVLPGMPALHLRAAMAE